jgi:hypothetical protein
LLVVCGITIPQGAIALICLSIMVYKKIETILGVAAVVQPGGILRGLVEADHSPPRPVSKLFDFIYFWAVKPLLQHAE